MYFVIGYPVTLLARLETLLRSKQQR